MPSLKRIPIDKCSESKGGADANNESRRHEGTDEQNSCNEKFSQPTNCHEQTTATQFHEPLSIASAISNSIYQTNQISDIVGVVLSIQHSQETAPVSKSNKKTNKVRILIADNSLSDDQQCVRVHLPSNSSNSELSLHPGDVIRLNGMEVRNIAHDANDVISSRGSKKQKVQIIDALVGDDNKTLSETIVSGNGLLKVICDLYPSWKEENTGPTMARLCRIDSSTLYNNDSDIELSVKWENVASSMETPRELIRQLTKWYLSNTSLLSSMQSISTACQRRRLREITTANIHSHVVTKVLRCERAIPKRNTGKATEPYITHATLSDGIESEDIMGLCGSIPMKHMSGDSNFIPRPIASILLQSLTEGCYILLTHMLSKSSNTSLGSESLMLMPTRDTIATVINPDHPFYIKNSPRREHAFASQPITLERAAQLYTMSQQHSPEKASGASNECRGMMAVVSPLQDIIVDGIFASLREGSYWQNNQSLSKFLIDTPTISTPFKSIKLSPTYRSATIVLDPSVFSKEMVINADSDALKLLCMDVPAQDMVMDWNVDGEEHPYLSHVGALLKGLCEEKTPIRWVLEQESESSWFVSSAALVEI